MSGVMQVTRDKMSGRAVKGQQSSQEPVGSGGIIGVPMPVNEGRRVEDVDDSIITEVEEGSDASVDSDILDVPTKDAPADKRLINRLNASSGLKVVVTVGRVVAPGGPPGGNIGVAVGIGGVESVEFRIGSGMVEFDSSVENIPPSPPAPLMIERALGSEVHPTN